MWVLHTNVLMIALLLITLSSAIIPQFVSVSIHSLFLSVTLQELKLLNLMMLQLKYMSLSRMGIMYTYIFFTPM